MLAQRALLRDGALSITDQTLHNRHPAALRRFTRLTGLAALAALSVATPDPVQVTTALMCAFLQQPVLRPRAATGKFLRDARRRTRGAVVITPYETASATASASTTAPVDKQLSLAVHFVVSQATVVRPQVSSVGVEISRPVLLVVLVPRKVLADIFRFIFQNRDVVD